MGEVQRTTDAAAPRFGAIDSAVQPGDAIHTAVQPCGVIDSVDRPCSAINTAVQPCGATLTAMPRRGAIILCGGHSRRFGSAKEWVVIDGETLLARTLRVVQGCVDEVVLAARPHQSLPELNRTVARVNDEVPDAGPLAGIVAGMTYFAGRCPVIFVTACDHPRLDPRFIECLLKQVDERDLALIPSHSGELFPLTAVYRSSLLAVFRDALAAGDRSVQRVATHAGARILAIDGHPAFASDVVHRSLLNVNDLAAWEAIGQSE